LAVNFSTVSSRPQQPPPSRPAAEQSKGPDTKGPNSSERLDKLANDIGKDKERAKEIAAGLKNAADTKEQKNLDKAASALAARVANNSSKPADYKAQTGAAQNSAQDNLAAQVKESSRNTPGADRLKAQVEAATGAQSQRKTAYDTAIDHLKSLANPAPEPKSNSSTRGNQVDIQA
jgi:hypothetical protein